jgi:hypothetical protein
VKETEEIIRFIAYRIGHIYFRPLMWAGTAVGVDLTLHYYHELWAEIHNLQEHYLVVTRKIHEQQKCGSASFARRYGLNNPNSSEKERAIYTVEQWRKISKKMGVAVPYTTIRTEFENNELLKNLFLSENKNNPKRKSKR